MRLTPFVPGICLSLTVAALSTMSILAQVPASAAHGHIAHVMTNGKDTPDMKGLLPTAVAVTALIGQIAIGTDANSDGQTGWQPGEGGLRQANTHMRLMMKAEGL